MSSVETIELGIALAERAIESDRNAYETNNHSLYHNAVTGYTRAIEMFSLAFTCERNQMTKQLLQDKVTMCRNRKAALQDYLTPKRVPSLPPWKCKRMPTKRFNEELAADHQNLQYLFTRMNVATTGNDTVPSLSDVVGLESAKEVLQEATMLPEQFPELFKERRAWTTILLYGPPGVGKTLLSRAIAAESNSRFFALTTGDLMAGSLEKCERDISGLFAAARRCGKVVFYFDDVDILFSSCAHESDQVRRVKGQVLKELQTLQESVHDVVFIATSRRPWILEEAFLRRMDRRVHVGLPDAKSRARMLEKMLSNVSHTLSREDIENIANECETYSGSDMNVLAKDADMERLRVIQDCGHFRKVSVERNGEKVELMSACTHDDDGAMEMRYTKIERRLLYIPPVCCLDFEIALDRTKPSVGLDTVEKHADFTRRKGLDG